MLQSRLKDCVGWRNKSNIQGRTFLSPKAVLKTALGDKKVRPWMLALSLLLYSHDISHIIYLYMYIHHMYIIYTSYMSHIYIYVIYVSYMHDLCLRACVVYMLNAWYMYDAHIYMLYMYMTYICMSMSYTWYGTCIWHVIHVYGIYIYMWYMYRPYLCYISVIMMWLRSWS